MLKRGRSILVFVFAVLAVTLVGWSVAVAGKPQPPPAAEYSLTELKVLPGFTASYGVDINDLGQVVGDMKTASGETVAVVWETPSAAPTELPLPDGYDGSRARAINDDGLIVGWAGCVASGTIHPVIWVPGLSGYEMQDLTGDPADGGYAWDINADGYVVGYLLHSGWTTYYDSEVAFVIRPEVEGDGSLTWFLDDDKDGVNDLMCIVQAYRDEEWGAWYVEPGAINDSGWVVGTCDPGLAYPGWTDFVIIPDYSLPNPWFQDEDGDGANDLAIILPGSWSGCYVFVNNEGQIVRRSELLGVVVQDDGTATLTRSPLPPTTTYGWYYAWGINDSAQVIGMGKPLKRGNPDYDPLLWQAAKGSRLLESLSDMAGFSDLISAYGINDLGQIVGSGATRAGERGYVASPK